ncbi:DUF3857 domain-containing protein [Olleya aquimaris]|uniref:DUF3857 domain-containing protein n=1 Tax=Olleya sediminilitoris TaxID=2795739 RepID=A0ABS1WJ74_9FLAO|nr:DUF3857 domain-containing protein [Olleya sediminilitoris]AXO81238.1 DUF3857 domain-containing protein [Olleya aquimaris]MBL7559161.1 DUF3857 domain-containing protein [Olleya sediminilitoris]
MLFNQLFKSISLILLFSTTSFSQDNFQSLIFNPELKKNADAIVRSSNLNYTIEARDKIVITEKRIVTVFNKSGEKHIQAVVYYDQSKTIKKLEAVILNSFGKEIKKIKKRDFLDVSVADGVSIFNDTRAKYFDYTTSSYPYTVVFESEVVSNNTAFIPQWFPVSNYYLSVEHASISIDNQTDIQLDFKEKNIKNYEITKLADFNYEANNLKAIKKEAYSPSFYQFAPSVKFALKQFSMLGVDGENNNWNEFGKWMSDELISGTEVLPESVISQIKSLTKEAKTDLEKAKIVYNFMQNKTRYISVQIGIGGWKPMLASDVDRLGYGDCKGLSNYTKALLDAVGVTSYYTIVYGGHDLRDIDQGFSSLQGNHAILSIPKGDQFITLECTNQTVPFGYNANFTDDRDVLIVTPSGGKIIHTKVYSTLENSQISNAKIILDSLGGFKANLNIHSKGTQYDKYRRFEVQTDKENKLSYKNKFSDINSLEINKIKFENDKDQVVFKESVDLSVDKYVTKAGGRWILQPNVFNKFKSAPPRYTNRNLDFEIDRGFIDEDEYKLILPSNISVEALQDEVNIKNKFGEYHFSITKLDGNQLVFKRKVIINKGQFLKEEYKAFRKFRLAISKHDNSKIILKTTNN